MHNDDDVKTMLQVTFLKWLLLHAIISTECFGLQSEILLAHASHKGSIWSHCIVGCSLCSKTFFIKPTFPALKSDWIHSIRICLHTWVARTVCVWLWMKADWSQNLVSVSPTQQRWSPSTKDARLSLATIDYWEYETQTGWGLTRYFMLTHSIPLCSHYYHLSLSLVQLPDITVFLQDQFLMLWMCKLSFVWQREIILWVTTYTLNSSVPLLIFTSLRYFMLIG